MKTGTKGAMIASAVAALFLASGAIAQESGSMGASGSAAQTPASVKCVGGNACKGNSACKSAQNDCKGKNACKGKGFVMTTTADECTAKNGHPAS